MGDPTMTTRDGFPDVRAMVEEILRVNPGASAEEINRQLARRMNAYNAAPQAALGGLSPDRMHQLLSGDWVASGALRLNGRLSLDELSDAALFADARTLLDYVATDGPVKETAARNLPRATVAALLNRLHAPRGRRASRVGEGMRIRNEQDVLWLWSLRQCLLFAGLLIRRKGLRISRRGRELLENDQAGELYALLFHTMFRTLNLAVLSRDDRHAGLQSTGRASVPGLWPSCGPIRDSRHCHDSRLVTRVNYPTSCNFPYEEHPDPIITTLLRAWFEGNCGSYIEDLKKRKGPEADQPHRVTYRKLVRG